MENQGIKKSNTTIVIIMTILIIAVIGLSGYIVYDKVLSKENETKEVNKKKENKDTTKNDEVKEEVLDPEIELTKILNKDCSYVAGTYKNGKGEIITLEKNCEVNFITEKLEQNNYYVNNGPSKNTKGFYEWGIFPANSNVGGAGLMLYPIGIEEPFFKTDDTKIRILIGQAAPTSIEEVFFKQ